MSVSVTVTATGPFFTKAIPPTVARAIEEQILDKVSERVKRGGQGQGVRVNTLRFQRVNRRELIITSSLRNWRDADQSNPRSQRFNPRTVGSAWTKKNIGIIKSMARAVTQGAVRKIAQELS